MNTSHASNLNPSANARIASIDALRGLTMLAMVFVNDIGGAKGLPWWMYHFSTTAGGAQYNGMTFVDWVFPAFLFCMGMSVPAAIDARVARGEPAWKIALHVLYRAAALILIGIFKVNQTGAIAAIGWPAGLWNVLMFACVIAAFCTLPNLRAMWIARAVGFAGLVALAAVHAVYVGPMPPKWWEILGIIGWAYLAGAMVYSVVRYSRAGITLAIALLLYLYVLERDGLLRGPNIFGVTISGYLAYGSTIGVHAAIAVTGMLVATTFAAQFESAIAPRLKFFAGVFAGCVLAAAITYPSYGVNKDLATPAWAMLSAAATVLVFVPLWFWVDVRGAARGSWLLRVAGANALLIYLLQSALYPLFQFIANSFGGRLSWLVTWHGELGRQGALIGCARGAGLAVALTLFAWGLNRVGFRLKL